MYLFENGQLLEQMEAITLEKREEEFFDEATINEFFRAMHTIKGSSGVMMYDNIAELSHKLEDVFYYMREAHSEHIPHQELVSYILDVTDFISGEFEKIKDGNDPDGDPGQLIHDIDKFLEKIKNNMKKSGSEVPEREESAPPAQFYIAPTTKTCSHYYRIKIRYHSNTQMCNMRAYASVFALKDIAEDLLYYPEDIISNEASADEILADGFHILLQSMSDQDEVRNVVDSISEVESIDVVECSQSDFLKGLGVEASSDTIDLDSDVATIEARANQKDGQQTGESKSDEPQPGDYVIQSKEPGKPKQLAKNQKERKEKLKQNFISVNVSKMDSLMDLIGEIVIAQSVVLQNPDLKVPGLNLSNFNKAARQLTKFTSELQDVIMSMRMMPLTNSFQKINRVIYDTSRKVGKEIEVELIGENTEVDKSIIEHISDPLMHMARNSVDHGIESEEERIEAGKNPKGKITLEAKNEGGKVFISVKDDGKGLNAKKLFQKAQEKDLVSDKCSMSDFTDKEIYQFITLPGFSTKEEVTELSGRGVGMDVVVRNIQEIGGRLEIDSKEGMGTSITMKIPLTLAIIQGIVMVVGGTTFVIETNAVKEFLSVQDVQVVEEPNGEEYVMLREECYPVIRLNERYHLNKVEDENKKEIIIIIEHEDKKASVFVDYLIGEQEIVVKPVPTYIKHVDGISGCTQLGDGSLALILDVGGLI